MRKGHTIMRSFESTDHFVGSVIDSENLSNDLERDLKGGKSTCTTYAECSLPYGDGTKAIEQVFVRNFKIEPWRDFLPIWE